MDYNQNYQNGYQNGGYQQNSAPMNDGAIGWDDEIEYEDAFVLLPDGDYWFKVMKIDKGRYDGGPKISACPKAIVTLEIICPDGQTVTLTEQFLLHEKVKWKISHFFASIGMLGDGEKKKMNWSPEIIGKTGICKVIQNRYNDTNTGEERTNNKIKDFYPSYDQPNLPPPVQAQPTYSQPKYQAPPQGYGQPAQAYQQPAYAPPQGYALPQGGWNGGGR